MTIFNGTNGADVIIIDFSDSTVNVNGVDDPTALMSGDEIRGLVGNDAITVVEEVGVDPSFDLIVDGGNGNDDITSGSGNDTLSGGNGVDVLVGGAGEDTIDGGGRHDDIFGDEFDPREFIIAGTIDDTVEVVTFDSDLTLSGAGGDDEIYGDLVAVSFQATGTSSSAVIANKTVVFGSEEATMAVPNGGIFGGDGKDTLYGDLLSLDITATGGSDLMSSALVDNNAFTFGDDDIEGETGSDTIHGDLLSLDITATGGNWTGLVAPEADVQARVTLNSFAFGADDILGGSGSDTIYGDLLSLDITATGGSYTATNVVAAAIASATVLSNSFTFGADNILGGSGSDTLYGDLLSLAITATGGNIRVIAGTNFEATVSLNNFAFGADNIWGEAGSDTIYGDLLSLNVTATGGSMGGDDPLGPLIPTEGEVSSNSFAFGNDDIWGEAGNDILYGDLASLSIDATGGSAPFVTNPHPVEGEVALNSFEFGNDNIWGGTGSDTIYGDLLSLNITAIGGSSTMGGALAQAIVSDNTFDFGNDVISGGSAADVLFGDLESLTTTVVDGPGFSNDDGFIDSNTFTFGDDMLDGGDNNDTLYGDFLELNLPGFNISSLMTIAGHINIVYFKPGLFPNPPETNTFEFGNDILTGGTGRDVFSFTLLEAIGELVMPGNDQITDFDLGDDTLEFRDVIDVDNSGGVDIDDLAAVTTVSLEDVDGDTIVDDLLLQFDVGGIDAGSVALLDFSTNNPGAPIPISILDLAAAIDIVPA